MKKTEFDNLRAGDKVRKRAQRQVWTVILNDCKSVVAVHGEKGVKAARLINPMNWRLGGGPNRRMTDGEFDQLGVGAVVCHASDYRRMDPFTVALVDRDFIVAVKGSEIATVERFHNPPMLCLLGRG